jgi:rRNA maturation protein Nop10
MTDDELFAEPNKPVPGTVWWTGHCVCTVCGHKAEVEIPIESSQTEPVVNLECSSCGNMTMRPE